MTSLPQGIWAADPLLSCLGAPHRICPVAGDHRNLTWRIELESTAVYLKTQRRFTGNAAIRHEVSVLLELGDRPLVPQVVSHGGIDWEGERRDYLCLIGLPGQTLDNSSDVPPGLLGEVCRWLKAFSGAPATAPEFGVRLPYAAAERALGDTRSDAWRSCRHDELVHGSLTTNNLLQAGESLTGVIDFEATHRGDAMWDAALLLMSLRLDGGLAATQAWIAAVRRDFGAQRASTTLPAFLIGQHALRSEARRGDPTVPVLSEDVLTRLLETLIQ